MRSIGLVLFAIIGYTIAACSDFSFTTNNPNDVSPKIGYIANSQFAISVLNQNIQRIEDVSYSISSFYFGGPNIDGDFGLINTNATANAVFNANIQGSGSKCVLVTVQFKKINSRKTKIWLGMFELSTSIQYVPRDVNLEETSGLVARVSGGDSHIGFSGNDWSGEDSISSWNAFYITAISGAVNTVNYSVSIPGVLVGYGGVTPYYATINNGATKYPSVTVNGQQGTYSVTVTVTYKVTGGGSTVYTTYGYYPLTINGAKKRSVDAVADDSVSANGNQFYFIGIAGVAVAAVAVVAAVAIVRRKTNTSTAEL